jgi:hypothetical protein
MGQAANTANSFIDSQSQGLKQKLAHKVEEDLHCIKLGTYEIQKIFLT